MDHDDNTMPAPKRVSPMVAAQFADGRDVSTFRSQGTGYAMRSVFQCRTCAERGHPGLSLREFQFLAVGFTTGGFQAWCKRCESEVLDKREALPWREATERALREAMPMRGEAQG